MMRKLFGREKKGQSSGSSPSGSTTVAPHEEPFPSGIKQLYESPETCDVDIVFIHGLDGNREKTWTAKGAQGPWPKTLLPLEIPSARILTFGYDAYAAKWKKGGSQNRIGDHAWNLLTALASCREDDDRKDRPIIFVCHSLGGLLCKDALVVSKMQLDLHLHNIYDKTRAIAFLGTPHRGSDLAIWAERLLKSVNLVGRRNKDIVGVLNEKSEVLERIHEAFLTMIWGRGESVSKQIEITCFYEELLTSIRGFNKIVVSKNSATLPGSVPIGIHRDHTQMTKFADQEDPGFKAVCGELRRWAMNAKVSHPRHGLVAPATIDKDGSTEANLTLRQKDQPESSHQVKFVVPYLKNGNFVGRTEILEELKARLRFTEANCDSQRKVSLFGLGGAGKTQIALALIHWLRETTPEVSVIWVHASNTERFLQSFSSIAQEFQIPGFEDPQNNVLLLVAQWLKKKDCGKWLMVLDNADDAELLFGKTGPEKLDPVGVSTNLVQYLPECTHGALLITTRNKQVGVKLAAGDGSTMVEVGVMDMSESERLLKGSLKGLDPDEEEIRILSSRLDHLPLALAQAASFIRMYDMTVGEYLELLSEGDKALIDLLSEEFETSARDRDTSRAVAETWMISFRQIKKQNPLASELLSIMSFLDRQDIAIKILREYNDQHQDGPMSNIELKKSIGILKNFSLITEQKNGSLDMHRLVQLVTKSWLAKTEASDQFRRKALVTVSHLYPYGKFENRAVCRAYLAHALAVLELGVDNDSEEAISRANLLHSVGAHFWEEGKYAKAGKMFQAAVEIRTSGLGRNDPDTLTSMNDLALTFWNQGRYQKAEELHIQVLEARKILLSEDHSDTLRSMNNLALTFRAQGRYQEAEELQIQVLEARKISLGEDHPDTLNTINNLASTFWDQGRYQKAKELQIQVLEARKISLGEDHPDTLNTINNLASTFWDQGRYQKAEELQIQVLEARKISLGEDHPDTLISMNNLASTFWNQGRYQEAEELQIQVLEACKISLGEDHSDTLRSMNNLASTFWNQGRYQEAEELQIQVLEACKISLGEDHPDTLNSMANLSHTLYDLGLQEKALGVMTSCFQKRKIVLGKDHPDTVYCADVLESWNTEE